MSAPWNSGYPQRGGMYGAPNQAMPTQQNRKRKKKDKPPFLVFNILTPRGRRTTGIFIITAGLVVSHAWQTDTVQQIRQTVTTTFENGVQLPTDITDKLPTSKR